MERQGREDRSRGVPEMTRRRKFLWLAASCVLASGAALAMSFLGGIRGEAEHIRRTESYYPESWRGRRCGT